MKKLERPKIFEKIENIVIGVDSVLLVVITLLVTFQVIARKLNISVTGTEELSRYSYVIFAFLAWPIAALEGTDVAVTFIFDKFPSGIRTKVLAFYHILMAVFAGIASYSIYLNALNARGVVGASNRWLQVSWVFWIVMVGLIATTIFNIVRCIFLITGIDTYISQEEKDTMELEMNIEAFKEEEELKKGGEA